MKWTVSPTHSPQEVLSEFELFYHQVESSPSVRPSADKDLFKAKLTNLAHEYANVKQDRNMFPLGKEHRKALGELRRNKDIFISRPDKGAEVVLLNRQTTSRK